MNDDFDTSVLLLDVETTGTNKAIDQVIELAVQYGFDTYDEETQRSIAAPVTVWRFKPTVPIHPGAQAVHGISAQMLAKELPFKASAQRLALLLDAAEVLIGYNVRFDLEMLDAEFSRLGMPTIDLHGKYVVDPYRLWQQREPRGLKQAHERFVGVTFENAHNAAADIAATGRVALGMIDAFELQGKDWGEIAEICDPERKFWLGGSNHFRWVYGAGPTAPPSVIMTFGKHKDMLLLELAATQRGYLQWMVKQDFPSHVKTICQKALSLRGQAFLAWAAETYPPPPATVVSEENAA